MGQIIDKFRGKDWRDKQVKAIADEVFANLKKSTGKAILTADELYIAVLLVFNGINKCFPGVHFDPPTREQVKIAMKNADLNLDGELTEDEFLSFVNQFSVSTVTRAGERLLYTLVLAPSLAASTKKHTENVPVVGKAVQAMPTHMYATLVTFAAMWLQQSCNGQETIAQSISTGGTDAAAPPQEGNESKETAHTITS